MANNSTNKIYKEFSRPDIRLACIELGNDRVYGKIKNKQALLLGIPNPDTGYHFNDIVEVSNQIGTTYLRDDEIPVYKAIKVIHSSNQPTFSFEAIVPASADWFDLSEVFRRQNTGVRFPFQDNSPVRHWVKGYCIASNIGEVKSILEQFIISGENRKVKNIEDTFNDSNSIAGEIDGNNFVLELKNSRNLINIMFIVFSMPVILFIILAFKFGLHSASEIFGFIITVLFFICLEIYSFFRLSREKITVNKNGIIAEYPIVKQKSMDWDDIIDVKLSVRKNYIVFKNSHRQKIRIDDNLKPYRVFCLIAKNLVKNETHKIVFDKALKNVPDLPWKGL